MAERRVPPASLSVRFPVFVLPSVFLLFCFSAFLTAGGSPQNPTLEQLLARAAAPANEIAVASRTPIILGEQAEQTFLTNRRGGLLTEGTQAWVEADQIAHGPASATVTLKADDPNGLPWSELRKAGAAPDLTPSTPARIGKTTVGAVVKLAGQVDKQTPLPRVATIVLAASVQPKFEFRMAGAATIAGVRTFEVTFRQRDARIFSALFPLSGSLWIDPNTGRVMKSVIRSGVKRSADELTATYERDATTGLWLPSALRQKTAMAGESEWWMEAKGTLTLVAGPR